MEPVPHAPESLMHIALVGNDAARNGELATLLNNLGYPNSTQIADEHTIETRVLAGAGLFVLDLNGSTIERACILVERLRDRVGALPPILLLAEELAEETVAQLYASGADDVMVAPMRNAVFAARIQALARRAYPRMELPSDVLRVAGYAIDIPGRRLSLHGHLVKLSQREFDLALYLFRHVGKLVMRTVLEKSIWGRELGFDSKTVDTHMYRLRLKLKLQPENGLQLASVYAQGFRLIQVLPSAQN